MADAERDRAGVQLREIAVEQILDDRAAGRWRRPFSGILRLVSNVRPDSVTLPRARASLNSSCSSRVGQHDEAALGAGDLDGRIEHQRQHFVEHAARSERAQPFEQRGHLPQLGRRRTSRSSPTDGASSSTKKTMSVSPAWPRRIASPCDEHLLGRPLAVDEGAEPRLLVAKRARRRSRS